MLRTIVFFGILAGCAFMAGWFTIQRDEDETTIRFNREEIRADASKAIAKGRELLDQEGISFEGESPSAQPTLFQSPASGDSLLPFGPESSDSEGPQGGFGTQQASRFAIPWGQPAANNVPSGTQQY
jgi:hypothetical protein